MQIYIKHKQSTNKLLKSFSCNKATVMFNPALELSEGVTWRRWKTINGQTVVWQLISQAY